MTERTETRASGRWAAALPSVAGAVLAALGMLVLIGWLTGNAALVQVIPTFAPMQYNEALGFLLAGAALLGRAAGRAPLARGAAALLLVLAALTLVQYVTGFDLGIDRWLVEPYITVGTSHPGRMAPNTAVCFTLAALTLLFGDAPRSQRTAALHATLAVIVAALGTLALAGYVASVPAAYGWGQLTGMAVLASLGMIVLGGVLFARSWQDSVERWGGSPAWLPLAAGVGGLTTTLCLWQSFYAHANAAARTRTGLDEVVLVVGIVMALLFAFLLRFAQQADRRAKELAVAYRELAEARDAALESARMKSEFLANMSHEIRTPLNGVIGMTDLLLTTDMLAEQRDYAEMIRASADSLLTIVNDILDFSKIEAGMLAFESLDFGLRNLVESTVEMFAEPARRKKLELATLVYSDVPDALRGDPGRLRQVLTNLIGNAVKFTLAGEVTVRVLNERDSKGHAVVRFMISDTGIGIAPDEQAKLFQPFVQADGSTARQFGGTGLGLAISKQLVERMDGEIGVDSEPGVGSTFWFTARLEKQPQHATGLPGDVSLNGRRVLVVDDNETNRTIVRHYVMAWGLRVEEAAGGAEALAMLRDAAEAGDLFDLAIMDLMMPGMTGFELARMIKSDASIAATRLVLMPSFGKRGHASDARDAGIAAYLVKPVRQSELHDCLLAVIADTTGPVEPTGRLVTRHTLAESARRPRSRILIAEDNLVNQKVMMAQVSKLGYRADLVNNGEEALAALERYPYALVLMDCQMPRMDGYTATRRIRERERAERHTPIIAITANAMAGEREKCEEAGMDDYLSKPVRQEDLRATIERWLPLDEEERSGGPAAYRGDPGIIYKAADIASGVAVRDLPVVTDRWSGVRARLAELGDECGPELLASLIRLFVDDAVARIDELYRAVAGRDAARVEALAHALKGSCRNFGADEITALLEDLEDRGERGEIDATDAARARRIETEFQALRRQLLPLEDDAALGAARAGD